MGRDEIRADFQNELFDTLDRARSRAKPRYVFGERYVVGADLPGVPRPLHFATRFNWNNPRDDSDAGGTPEVVLVVSPEAKPQIAALAASEADIRNILGSGSRWFLNRTRWNFALAGPPTDLRVADERDRAVQWTALAMDKLIDATRSLL